MVAPVGPLFAAPAPFGPVVSAAQVAPPVDGVPVRVEDGVFLVHPNVAEKYCIMPLTLFLLYCIISRYPYTVFISFRAVASLSELGGGDMGQ